VFVLCSKRVVLYVRSSLARLILSLFVVPLLLFITGEGRRGAGLDSEPESVIFIGLCFGLCIVARGLLLVGESRCCCVVGENREIVLC
jgi:hypothetical protein